ncbi:exosortase/archaeosortase family protein [Fontisphaera persica]|uniref:exosortase/archaeosortase family protein n=1 Tax=Fontisphaera persica TaxID=2974023 RepID=UPI0024BF6DB2|nr:exosortase/archaeosortase family protein [Fontisphaera persica]WCJ59098.1 exosortase/archaeosortase family protein [Fontisphaera persica]
MNALLSSPLGKAATAGALGLLWLTTAWRLGPLWSSRPEYAFGWAGPVLCAVLLWERWRSRPAPAPPAHSGWGWAGLFLCLGGLLWAKLLLEVAPILRPAAWALAGCMAGVLGSLAWLAGGGPWLRHLAFPLVLLLFFLPWPTRLEQWVMQHLVHFNVQWVIHTLGILGIPALARGNLLELEVGGVSVDEACSGIRSLQATLVAALFLGELGRLPAGRRLKLLGASLVVAMAANFLRTLGLAWLAARQGPAAVQSWHDPAGYGVLILNFLALLGLMHWLSTPRPVPPAVPMAGSREMPRLPGSAVWILGLSVLGSEVGMWAWFARQEKMTAPTTWRIEWPEQQPGFRRLPLGPHVQTMLGYDEGSMAAWTTAQGARIQAVWLRWKPSAWRPSMARAAMAQGHSPTVCLPAVGMELLREGPPVMIPARGQEWPCQNYLFDDRGRSVYVYVCLWRDRPDLVNYQVNKRAMLREIWRALRRGARPLRTEQRLIMASVHGARSEGEARAWLAAEWERWVKE